MAQANSVESGLLPIWREMVESGEALPSEEALAAALGTSRPAIREALIRMEADGLVRRHHGAGTFPNPAALDIPVRLDRAADFVDRLSAVGFTVELELLDAEVIVADEAQAIRLEVDPGTRLLRTSKRWRANGDVAAIAVDLVPLERRADADAALAAASRPVLELSKAFGLGQSDWLCTWPSAIEADDEVAKLLEHGPGRAVMRMEQVGVERHGRRVFHALEHHKPGVVEYGLIRTVHG